MCLPYKFSHTLLISAIFSISFLDIVSLNWFLLQLKTLDSGHSLSSMLFPGLECRNQWKIKERRIVGKEEMNHTSYIPNGFSISITLHYYKTTNSGPRQKWKSQTVTPFKDFFSRNLENFIKKRLHKRRPVYYLKTFAIGF